MRIGKLRNQIEVQRKSSTRDTDGGERVEWSTITTVWAAIEPGANREYWGSEQVQAETGVRIRARYPLDVLPQDRIKHGTNYYNVHGASDKYTEHREIHIMATIGVNDGR